MAAATPRIAIVDDDPRVLRGLQRLLMSEHHEVDVYSSGAAFLEAVAACQPDCLLLDLNMPRMSGHEVQARLAQRAVRIPVVVITGDDTPESFARAVELGAAACLGKPVDKSALLGAIRAALAAHALQPNPPT